MDETESRKLFVILQPISNAIPTEQLNKRKKMLLVQIVFSSIK
jgi:hypothetical protein